MVMDCDELDAMEVLALVEAGAQGSLSDVLLRRTQSRKTGCTAGSRKMESGVLVRLFDVLPRQIRSGRIDCMARRCSFFCRRSQQNATHLS